MKNQFPQTQYQWKVLHLFSGSGGAVLGFQRAQSQWEGLIGRFRTLAGIDVDPLCCEDMEYLTGAKAVQMDLFDRRDYIAFHGKQPVPDWQEATPEDIRQATSGEYPDLVFLSPPCKGFSALRPEKSAQSDKYQALNRLTVRGIWLTLEAFKDDLPSFIVLENVPRILTRGKKHLNTITRMLEFYGYAVNGRPHDCGEIAGLGQHRRRYLLVARNFSKVSTFLYQPAKQRVKSIGEILGSIPLPDDPVMGPMHKLPRLEWKTWVRLALIPAGGDWRNLEGINPAQYRLEYVPRGGGPYGVMDWNNPAGTVIGNASIKGSNAAAVADPRLPHRDNRHPGVYQVICWEDPATTVTGTRFGSGAPAVADPRTGFKCTTHTAIYQVNAWDEVASTITGAARPNNGAISISDPRFTCSPRAGTMGVQAWDESATTVTATGDVHSGAAAVADPRIPADTDRPDSPPVIISLDGTWHRPLTTLELAALQGLPLFVNGKPLKLAGNSDRIWREHIGNMVPPDAAQVIAEQALLALLASTVGAWTMSANDIWVAPGATKDSNIFLAS